MGEKDITEKILLQYDDVFADIVNNLLFHGEERVHAEELSDQAPNAAYKADGRIRNIERDVAKRWIRNQIRIACFGIENQSGTDRDEVLRVYVSGTGSVVQERFPDCGRLFRTETNE